MESKEKAALIALRDSALKDVDAVDIEDSLISFGLLTISDKERIHAVEPSQRTNCLVDIIVQTSRPRAFDIFLESVKGPYRHVHDKLIEVRNSPQTAVNLESCDSVFIEGGVPITPPDDVELDAVAPLKEALVSLSKSSDGGWVVIWGPGGAGKSVMAAQALRGRCSVGRPVVAYFFNKVQWLTVGQLPPKRKEAALLEKMQNFCKRLDSTLCVPANLEAARDTLRSTLLQRYPACLLVLDDVWDPLVAKFFNVQSRVLITTRSADVLSRVEKGRFERTKMISIDGGFTEQASLRLLRRMVIPDEPPSSTKFTNQFLQIHKSCNGSPFVVSIFGSMLRNRKMSKFEHIFKRYKDTLFDRQELDGGDYQYTSIAEAIMVSINDLSESDKNLFLRLSIFSSNSPLSPRFLATYCWTDLDEDDAADKMEEFVRRSIAIKEGSATNYKLHDLVVAVVQKTYEKETIVFNQQFVESVLNSRKSNSSWHDLEDDCQYLAQNFLYHLLNDNSVSLKDKQTLLLDFDYISSVCCSIGPDSLAFAYRYAVKELNLSGVWKEMEKFILSPVFRIQSLCFGGGHTEAGLIQLALSCVEGKELPNHAIETAQRHKDCTCFFQWMNRSQTEDQMSDTMEVGSNATAFSLNSPSTHVAVISDRSMVIKDMVMKLDVYRRLDKQFDTNRVIAVAFGPDKNSLWLLTTTRLIKYCLPEEVQQSEIASLPAPTMKSNRHSLIFPKWRNRANSNEVASLAENEQENLTWPDDPHSKLELTAFYFQSDQKLIVGSRLGRIYEVIITDSFLNCSYDYSIERQAPENERCVNHISGHLESLVVSGPDFCTYVFESRPNDSLTDLNCVRKYTKFREQRSPPIQSLFDQLATPRFVATITNSELHLWHPHTLETLLTDRCDGEFTSLGLSSDGVHLAVSTNRAHIYLYRISDSDGRVELELIDEFNGTGSQARCLTFRGQFLYSLSDVLSQSMLTKWRISAAASPCMISENRRQVQRQSSVFFGGEKCCTLRLRTSLAATVKIDEQLLIACQSVRRSLLILESHGKNLRHIGKYKGDGTQLQKTLAVGLSADGKRAVFTFAGCIVAATSAATTDDPDKKWQFVKTPVAVKIRELVMLPDNLGFLGSDKRDKLVAYNSDFSECVRVVDLNHLRLQPLPAHFSAFPDACAIVLTSKFWCFVTKSLEILESPRGSISNASELVCVEVSIDGCYVAGGLSTGELVLWQTGCQGPFAFVKSRSTGPLRCLSFSTTGRLLAGAFDKGRFSLWLLKSGDNLPRITPLLDSHPVSSNSSTETLQSTEISLAWSTSTSWDGSMRHRLILASDHVWTLCCLPDSEEEHGNPLDPGYISLVPIYSHQGVNRIHVLGSDGDLLFVDNSHAVFWMRALHGPLQRRGSVS